MTKKLYRREDLELAFVAGAKWWEWHKEHATMWPVDQDLALAEAQRRQWPDSVLRAEEQSALPAPETVLDAVRIICSDCAGANGATWPDGHCATIWNGTCEACNKATAVCDVSDWNWPRGKKPLAFSWLNRD